MIDQLNKYICICILYSKKMKYLLKTLRFESINHNKCEFINVKSLCITQNCLIEFAF